MVFLLNSIRHTIYEKYKTFYEFSFTINNNIILNIIYFIIYILRKL